MKNKRILMIVHTLYQLLNSINLRKTLLSDIDVVDIMVSDKTKYLNYLYKNKKLNDVFNKVYYADSSKLPKNKNSKTSNIKQIFNNTKNVKIMLGEKLDVYDEIFFFNNNEIFYEIYKYQCKRNKNIKFHLYEEGVISYLRELPKVYTKGKYTKLIKFIYNCDLSYIDYDMYFYRPKLFVGDSNRDIKNIELIDVNNKSLVTSINNAFDFKGLTIKEKYIFFEEAFEFIDDIDEYMNLIDDIAKCVGYENFIVKRHPRNTKQFPNSKIKLLNTNVSWEIFCINNNLDDKVLFTISSSAAVNTKTIFDNNAKIILLYKLLKGKFLIMHEKYFEKFFQNICRNDNNIKVVYDKKQLSKMLNDLEEKI